jgi:ATP-dependent helicase/nuclease subunit A
MEGKAMGRANSKREQPGLTQQQHAAIYTRDVSIGLSAGAGCGKTFVLTQRFLSHLEPSGHDPQPTPSMDIGETPVPRIAPPSTLHPPPLALGHLVAITFTERAAREMRDRIRAECRRRLRECPDEEVAHWQSLLREIDGARISTIHGFCAGLLRSHAVEAGLDPRFELLDEATSTSFLRTSVAESVRELLAARNPDAMELVLEFGLEGTEDLVRSLIGQRFRIDFAAWESMTPSVLAQQWLDRWRTRTVPDLIARLWKSDTVRLVKQLLSAHEPGHAVMQERRSVMVNLLSLSPSAADPAALLAELRENSQVKGGGGEKSWESKEVYERVRDALAALREEIDKLGGQLESTPDDAQTAAVLGLMALRVTRHATAEYARAKQQAGLLDFDDLLLLTRDLLRDHTRVRERVAGGISLLMVDEFQDTDPVQAEIVRHLCGGGITDGKLFFVGDAKQSIYRFRRADPAVFDALRSELDERGRLPLSRNFRSQPSILQFVNALLDGAMSTEYEPLVAHHEQLATAEPTIEFLFTDGLTSAEPSAHSGIDGSETLARHAQPLSPSGGEGSTSSVDDLRRREADWIAARVQQMLTDDVPRVRDVDSRTGRTGLRPAQSGDVAILFRALTDVRHYEAALRERDLPYYLVGGRAFFAQQEIFDLINLCRYLLDQDDEVSLVGLLRSPFFGLSDDSLLALAERSTGSFATHPRPPSPFGGEVRTIREALDAPHVDLPEEQRDRVVHAARMLAELERERHRLPVAGLLNLALDRTGYDAALLLEFLGPRKLANLRKLIEMARELDRSGLFGLSEFVEWLQDAMDDEAKEELAAIHPEAGNVIRLMTIHQAKGLEFPIVVVPDMDRKLNSRGSRIRFDPELGPLVNPPEKFGRDVANIGRKMFDLAERDAEEAESLRLLYVATTRAADHLILSAGLNDFDKLSSPWMKLLASRFDLRTGQTVPPGGENSGFPAPHPQPLSPFGGEGSVRFVPAIRVHTSRPEPARVAATTKAVRLPLDQFREAVTQTEPVPLPHLLEPLRPDANAPRTFSVSELEAAEVEAIDLDGVDWGFARLGSQRDELNCQRRLPHTADLSPPARARGERASHADVVSDSESKADMDRNQLGTLVHAMLERAGIARDFRSLEDFGSLIAACWDVTRGELSPAMREAAESMVDEFLRSPLAAEVASSRRVFRELDFGLRWPLTTGPHPPHLITGTIDCAYQTDQRGWAILDYKTVTADSQEEARELLGRYAFQLGVYSLALEQWLGKMPERVELVLLRGGGMRAWICPTSGFREAVVSRLSSAVAAQIAARVGSTSGSGEAGESSQAG